MHATVQTKRAIAKTRRDALQRAMGAAAAVRSAIRTEDGVANHVLEERVRAKLGRHVSHPHALDVVAADGVVRLSGAILAREERRVLRAVNRIRGVRDVINELEVHDRADNVPSLQGGRGPVGDRADVFQEHWAPATRAAGAIAGAALAMAGVARRGMLGASAAIAGAGLLARATANVPLVRLTGIGSSRRAVDIQKTITINAPLGEVYAFWSSYGSFPRFMSRVLDVAESVRNPKRSHWTVAGPAGRPIEFDAEIRRAIPNQLVAWRTLPGSPVAHAGVAQFEPESDGRTRVQIRMSYNPPAGWIGHGVATAFGVDPKSSMDADLARMKTLIETGRAPHDAAAWRKW
jgi:uncharacterized membrane protein